MRIALAVSAALAVVVGAAAAPGIKGRGPKEESITGDWVCQERVIAGKPDPAVQKSPPRFTITADQWMIQGPPGTDHGSPLELDPKAKPPALTIYAADDKERSRGGTMTGIYKLNGDTLTICYVLGAGPRPTAFESKAGTEVRIMVLKRVKDK